jgi:hypothetical protein
MPVRATIHSSLVSTPRWARSAASSSLLILRGGSALPVPEIRE